MFLLFCVLEKPTGYISLLKGSVPKRVAKPAAGITPMTSLEYLVFCKFTDKIFKNFP